MKPGYKTTEFWTALGTAVASLVAVVFGNEDMSTTVESIFAGAGAVVVGAYAFSRAIVKKAESAKEQAEAVANVIQYPTDSI